VPLSPDVVQPRLRGSFGRTYYYAVETPSTQELPPEDAPHGAVALAEHQTAGRGRRDRVWIDEPGAGLTFSIVLSPPPPVSRWPELTIVAAEAVAGAIGPGASIKEPNDVLLDGAKVAGILAQARLPARVVLGIGVNVGTAPWEGAAAIGTDRLELLVEILDRFEQGYDAWVRDRSTGVWSSRTAP
jgi:BirA family biotin operon repressor/biotin-[acetyl-CoA-carboxylase] ligase